ncbi:TetR family transcriptional regulator [Amycolatopsis sp. WAC 01375]|uniref:TetR/AcrR family transcriptional regulator n=1 Tax=Amycolatopsis sp. WAC 01375 TaxID=2203194 RepID=UPI000F7934DB|nr:TetR/AcrR family transcriptional regulator [Amycolatopsis sp. WAC 01375]RSM78045.1 TetR family transcriptional regulator [Amycolatopsis sp. WAC 01375]
MSPRKSDPKAKRALLEIGARLLAEEGPGALSTRRVAAAAGSSTMGVYTHFGGMRGLVREIVHEGFSRLQQHMTSVCKTADPVADMALLGRAYRYTALANPHLYAVMFGGASLAGFSLSEKDRQHGRYTLSNVVECVGRCLSAGRFSPADAGLVAHQMWIATHGLVALELGDYLLSPWDADHCFEVQLVGLMVGAGDGKDEATRSVAGSRERMRTEFPAAAGSVPNGSHAAAAPSPTGCLCGS